MSMLVMTDEDDEMMMMMMMMISMAKFTNLKPTTRSSYGSDDNDEYDDDQND